MAWSTPLTAVSNAALTAAQWNASVRDNFLTTPAALATGTGQWFVANGANSVVARTPAPGTTVSTSQSTTSVAFTDLATVGPSLTTTIGVTSIAMFGCQLVNSGTGSSYMSYTGANFSASATAAVQNTGTSAMQASYTHFIGSATPGSTTFTCKYAAGSGTATFQDRRFQLLPF